MAIFCAIHCSAKYRKSHSGREVCVFCGQSMSPTFGLLTVAVIYSSPLLVDRRAQRLRKCSGRGDPIGPCELQHRTLLSQRSVESRLRQERFGGTIRTAFRVVLEHEGRVCRLEIRPRAVCKRVRAGTMGYFVGLGEGGLPCVAVLNETTAEDRCGSDQWQWATQHTLVKDALLTEYLCHCGYGKVSQGQRAQGNELAHLIQSTRHRMGWRRGCSCLKLPLGISG